MNWFRGIALGALLLVNASNALLLIKIHSARQHLQKDFADLNQLSSDVMQRNERVKRETEKLKALAESLPCKPQKGPKPKAGPPADVAASECALVHRPKSGCPQGYVQEDRPSFTEQDGSREFACISDNPAKKRCIDELRPGESFGMQIVIPIEPDTPEPASEGPKT
jgi:hypothetical protein